MKNNAFVLKFNSNTINNHMKLWQKFKFGIFDVDGTLFDNVEIMIDAFWKIIKKYDLPETEIRKIYTETNGMNLNDQFKLVFNKYGIKYDNALIKKLNKKIFALRDNCIEWQNAPLFPDTESLLKALRENNVQLFISSGSNTDEVIFRLKKAKIKKYFELIMGAEKIPKGSKHIELFANFCGLSPQKFASQAFLVSDGPNDMALAQKAGIFAFGITNTVSVKKLKSSGAKLAINNFKELTNLKF